RPPRAAPPGAAPSRRPSGSHSSPPPSRSVRPDPPSRWRARPRTVRVAAGSIPRLCSRPSRSSESSLPLDLSWRGRGRSISTEQDRTIGVELTNVERDPAHGEQRIGEARQQSRARGTTEAQSPPFSTYALTNLVACSLR